MLRGTKEKVCAHTRILGERTTNAPNTCFEHRHNDRFDSACEAVDRDERSFVTKMSQLMKIGAVYDSPTDPGQRLPPSGASFADRFTCSDEVLTDEMALAFTQVGIRRIGHQSMMLLLKFVCVFLTKYRVARSRECSWYISQRSWVSQAGMHEAHFGCTKQTCRSLCFRRQHNYHTVVKKITPKERLGSR